MRYYRPIKSDWFIQGFGQNLACARLDASGYPIWPYQVIRGVYPNACPAGNTKLYPLLGLVGHNGYDFGAWKGEAVHHSAEFDGWLKTEIDNQGGIGVDIVSKVPLKECTKGCPAGTIHYIKLRSWHLLQVIGFDGKEIKFGDMIGLADSTGISSGDHVHWGPKWCDEKGNGIHTDNGYYGAFDPSDEFENVFVFDIIKERKEADIRLAEEAKQKEEAARLRAELEEQIRQSQLTLIQLLRKFIFILQERLRKVAAGLGGLFK